MEARFSTTSLWRCTRGIPPSGAHPATSFPRAGQRLLLGALADYKEQKPSASQTQNSRKPTRPRFLSPGPPPSFPPQLLSVPAATAMAAPSGTMRAVQYDRYGGGAKALKNVEVPIPSPKKGEVLIRMEATSINVVDCRFQNGIARPFMPKKFPFISGFDFAGEVVELGAGVSGFKPGDKVVAINFPNGGGLAEYAVAPASRTVSRPPEVSAVDGVCVPMAAVTALLALRKAGVSLDPTDASATGKNVLVTAASGAVGHFAVQLARMGGHNVTATCGARNLDLVRSLGADEVLDYKTPEGAKLRSPSGRKYDVVVHCAKGFPWSVFRPVLAAKGTVVELTPGPGTFITAVLQTVTFSKKRLVPLLEAAKKEDMELLLGMLKQGKLKAVIDSRHPLASAHEGWAKSMSGHATGKVVIESELRS